MKTFKEQLTAEVLAHTGVTLCQTEDEERVEQHCRETAEQLEYNFWAWSDAMGLRCHSKPELTPTGDEAAELHKLPVFLWDVLNWTRGPAILVAHDIVSVVNHKDQGGPQVARMIRTVVQMQMALGEDVDDDEGNHQRMKDSMEQMRKDRDELETAYNSGDEHAVSRAATAMNITTATLAQQHEIPRIDRKVQLVLCDSEEMPRPCGADAIAMELPSREEIRTIVENFIARREDVVCEDPEAILDAAAGLTEFQIHKALSLSSVQADQLDAVQITEYKKRALQARGITWIDPDPRGFDAIGGLEPLKKWLKARALTFNSNRAADYGVEPARGVIISGPPGVAKSSLAGLLATEWSTALGSCSVVSLDVGALRQKYHGETEQNLRAALKTLDTISPAGGAPCVVLIDEADRGLAGSTSSGDLDGGVAGRVFQTLLTWMAERTSAAFLYMSSNHPDTIPSELTRSGRIDAMWWIGFPTDSERRSIIKIYKDVYPRASDVDVDTLVERSAGRTGAEIEGGFREASIQALADNKEQVTTLDVARALDVLPTVKSTFEMTVGMRSWKEAAMKANDVEMAVLDLTDMSSAADGQRQAN